MSWVIAGVAAGTAVLGAAQGAQKRKAQQEANQQAANVSAAQTEFSPWTHITPQAYAPQAVTDSAFGGAVQGGLGGAMFGQGLKKNIAEQAALDEEKKKAMWAQVNPNQA